MTEQAIATLEAELDATRRKLAEAQAAREALRPAQTEMAQLMLQRVAETKQAIDETAERGKALQAELVDLVRAAQKVGANMSKVAVAAGVTRQSLYAWLKD